MNIYLVTEGQTDAIVLRTILREVDLGNVRVMEAGGKSSAISLGTSLALNGRARAAILVDADTTEPNRISEQQLIFHDMQRNGADANSCRLFLAVPTLKAELFPTADAFASAFGLKLTPRQVESYGSNWTSVIKSFLSVPNGNGLTTLRMGTMAPASWRDLFSKPLLTNLFEFLRSNR